MGMEDGEGGSSQPAHCPQSGQVEIPEHSSRVSWSPPVLESSVCCMCSVCIVCVVCVCP